MKTLPRTALALAALVAASLPARPVAAFECHAALVLALDASNSVDREEYRLQLDGLAAALRDPAVRAAIAPGDGVGIMAMAFEWASRDFQRTIAPWTALKTPADIDMFAAALEAERRKPLRTRTAIGAALSTAVSAHSALETPCRRRLIDLSGDGSNNQGFSPGSLRDNGWLTGITVNALVIRHPSLDGAAPADRDPYIYYQREVIHGPGAFAMVVDSYDDYAEAIREKLLRELTPALSADPAPRTDDAG